MHIEQRDYFYGEFMGNSTGLYSNNFDFLFKMLNIYSDKNVDNSSTKFFLCIGDNEDINSTEIDYYC